MTAIAWHPRGVLMAVFVVLLVLYGLLFIAVSAYVSEGGLAVFV